MYRQALSDCTHCRLTTTIWLTRPQDYKSAHAAQSMELLAERVNSLGSPYCRLVVFSLTINVLGERHVYGPGLWLNPWQDNYRVKWPLLLCLTPSASE